MTTTRFFYWLLIFIFGLFLARAIDLVFIRGGYFRDLADNNRVKRIKLSPARGRVLDRNGNELIRNTVKYLDQEKKEVVREEALVLEAQGEEFEKAWIREYPEGEIAGHLTGYLGEVSKEELSEEISFGDLLGRGGLEQFYDQELRGREGEKLVEVGAQGGVVRVLGQKEPEPGKDLETSIDLKWQRSIAEAIKGKKGAVVVLDPQNGEVLALVSSPFFDPNLFTKERNEAEIENYLSDSDLPLFNRAIGGAYHPGSVFKIVTAVAGLEEGKIDSEKEIEDTGEIVIGEWRFGNWYWLEYGRKEGMVDLIKAIKRSNDIYFYKVGEWLGIENLLKWAKNFGLSQKTGIDLPGEVPGFLPSPEWKLENKNEPWFLGNTYHLAIGQGDLTTTPLQITLETGVIANEGKFCQPQIKKQEPICRELGIEKARLKLVHQGMIEACSSGGTGFPFFDFQHRVGCKTGTAEIGDGSEDTHAWFTLFYPVENPEVVITVLLERGGSGAYDAAPIAKEIIERYQGAFKPDKN